MLPTKKAFFLSHCLYQVTFAGVGKGLGFLVGKGWAGIFLLMLFVQVCSEAITSCCGNRMGLCNCMETFHMGFCLG